MSIDCLDKIVVVTGAGRGIGREVALFLARCGAKVVVNDPGLSADGAGGDESLASAVVAEIEREGGRATANFESVADWNGAKSIIDTAIDNFGRIDALVNVAGLAGARPFQELDADEFHRIVGASLSGSFYCARHAVPHMIAQRSGRIVNFVSRAGLVGVATATAYAAAKGGVFGLTNALALELAPHGILVNGVNPAATHTRMVVGEGEGRTGDPELAARMRAVMQTPDHVAWVTGYLCSDACDVTGQYYLVEKRGISLLRPLSALRTVELDDGEWGPDLVAASIMRLGRTEDQTIY